MHRLSGFCFAAVLLLAATATSAQTSVPVAAPQGSSSITFFVTATDKNGKPIQSFQPSDLEILENKLPVAGQLTLRPASELAFRIVLLIDSSNSVKRSAMLADQLTEVQALIRALLRTPEDQISVMPFDTVIRHPTDFVNKKEFEKLDIKLSPSGGTALYGAIFFACRYRLAKTPKDTHRILIVLSDGANNDSRISREQAVSEAQRTGVTVFGFNFDPALDSTNVRPQTTIAFRELAEETGGEVFEPTSRYQVKQAVEDLRNRLAARYTLTYSPTTSSDKKGFHKVRISSTRKGIRMRAPRGYYEEQIQHSVVSEPSNPAQPPAAREAVPSPQTTEDRPN